MLDILKLLQTRTRYAFGGIIGDKWIDSILNESTDEAYFISTEGLFSRAIRHLNILSKYNVSGIFELGSPLLGTAVRLTLFTLTVNHVDVVNTSICNIQLYTESSIKKDRISEEKKGTIKTFDLYPESYTNYINSIENLINKNITPTQQKQIEFNSVPYSDFSPKKPFARHYSMRVYQTIDLLKKEKTFLLRDVAEILIPHAIKDNKALVVSAKDFNYPLDYDKLEAKDATDVLLQKGDIICFLNQMIRMYLITETPLKNICASKFHTIIRPLTISPEYLITYLQSDTCRVIIEANMSGSVLKKISIKDISNIPIIKPQKKEEEYRRFFEINYLSPKRTDVYNEFFSNKSIEEHPKTVGDILNIEMFEKVKFFKYSIVFKILKEDMQELNACFNAKAYKATLILAGSILEAVLIDWMSDIDNKNYFVEEYIITDRFGKSKRADLIDYINAIREIKKPDWMDEADKAHKIRSKRNLVHAKLCMKTDEINENICVQVIGYLKDVISTRSDFID
ncbi:MAG: hypothetical protein BWY15_00837 [Firmicutes bacterium ADurb.Bin193]|nr:MAG: hypothetical protein BWY15_00837 [Firmicutes bacterium ADurb.Bin193]